jgi:hypothetical protein
VTAPRAMCVPCASRKGSRGGYLTPNIARGLCGGRPANAPFWGTPSRLPVGKNDLVPEARGAAVRVSRGIATCVILGRKRTQYSFSPIEPTYVLCPYKASLKLLSNSCSYIICELGDGEGRHAMKRKRQRLGSYGAGTLGG